MKRNLEGKVALVTGGSRGIGAAIVERLAAEGADVAFSYVSAPARAESVVRSAEARGVKALALVSNQADVAQAAELVRTVRERFGRLDILVNSAGVFVTGKVDDANADVTALQRQLAVNVAGVAATVRAAAPLMTDGGRIVSIGTSGVSHIAHSGIADYVATKAALAAYTRGWARDLGSRGITVNIVQPGPIATDMNPDAGEFASVLKSQSALGRYGTVEEVAAAVAFLVGFEASFITGAALTVDGGLSA